MTQMDMLTCNVRQAGDIRNVVARGPTRPVSYPEYELLKFLHGDRNVFDAKFLETRETTETEEINRLKERYGKSAVFDCFGKRPRLDYEAPNTLKRKARGRPPAPPKKGAVTSPLPDTSEIV